MNAGTKTCPFCGSERLAIKLPQHISEECTAIEESDRGDTKPAPPQ
jgi:RNA polymerase subunit RPABC4/transcription elongation factor Spt4